MSALTREELEAHLKAAREESGRVWAEARADFRAGMADVRSEITEVRSEIADVRSEITEVRSEITEVRSEIGEVRSEMRACFSDQKADFAERSQVQWKYFLTTGIAAVGVTLGGVGLMLSVAKSPLAPIVIQVPVPQAPPEVHSLPAPHASPGSP